MVFLFDLDGVVMDTESFYTEFWNGAGERFLGETGFGLKIKGQTLAQIVEAHFPGREKEVEELVAQLDAFEESMPYRFIPGAEEFLKELKRRGLPAALVTSSNQKKLDRLYRAHPDFPQLFDVILKSEDFTKSKPDPECFLKGMELLGGTPETTVVFEDSVHGLTAARRSGARVVGLATTNPREVVSAFSDVVIGDFTDSGFLEKILTSGI